MSTAQDHVPVDRPAVDDQAVQVQLPQHNMSDNKGSTAQSIASHISDDTLRQVEAMLRHISTHSLPRNFHASSADGTSSTETQNTNAGCAHAPGFRASIDERKTSASSMAVTAYLAHLTSSVAALFTARSPPIAAQVQPNSLLGGAADDPRKQQACSTGWSMSSRGLVFTSSRSDSQSDVVKTDSSGGGGLGNSAADRGSCTGLRHPLCMGGAAHGGTVSAAVQSLSVINDHLAAENHQLLQQLAQQQSTFTVAKALHGNCNDGVSSPANEAYRIESDAHEKLTKGVAEERAGGCISGQASSGGLGAVQWEAMPAILGCGTWQKLLESMLALLGTLQKLSFEASNSGVCCVTDSRSVIDEHTSVEQGMKDTVPNKKGQGHAQQASDNTPLWDVDRLEASDGGCDDHVQGRRGSPTAERVVMAIAKAAVCLQGHCETLQGQLLTSMATGVRVFPSELPR